MFIRLAASEAIQIRKRASVANRAIGGAVGDLGGQDGSHRRLYRAVKAVVLRSWLPLDRLVLDWLALV